MTKAEWTTCTDSGAMLEFLIGKTNDPKQRLAFYGGKASDRKLRLFACACCRRIWSFIKDARSRTAVEVAEALADGVIGIEEVRKVRGAADCFGELPDGIDYAAANAAFYSVFDRCSWVENAASQSVQTIIESALAKGSSTQFAEAAERDERAAQSDLLRDIFGNPFHPVATNTAWLSPAITSTAQTIYEEYAFERMPELADALEKVGCMNSDILEHCRGTGPHMRGCWVIDLLLGKE